jgi:hypothetical protein
MQIIDEINPPEGLKFIRLESLWFA